MNIHIVCGHIKTLLGAGQQFIGRAIGNRTLAEAGQRRYFEGKGQIVRGDAQQVIKRCLNRLQIH